MSPLPSITDDDWRSERARIMFPILVEYAHNRLSISYGALDKEIVRRSLGKHLFATRYGGPAGVIGNACGALGVVNGKPIPPINLIVVNGYTKIPGGGADSYMQRFGRDCLGRHLEPELLSKKEWRAIIEQAHQHIFNFPSWGEVLEAYGLKQTSADRKQGQDPRWSPNPAQWQWGPESEQHKALKKLIAENPAMVQLPKQQRGKEEYRLWSGDELDVYFCESEVAVEVKAAGAADSEIHRGLFQCVKYKAVLQAQQIYNRAIPTADCILVLGGKLPTRIREAATLFGVRVFDRIFP